jgi:phage terminase large subunit-like protein
MNSTSVLDNLSPLKQLYALKWEQARRRSTRKIDQYYPETGPLRRELYAPHMAFFKAGTGFRERCIMAANRIGKSEGVGGYETALHLTGIYPPWWEGRVFNKPVNAWMAGDTGQTVRDILQYKLLGKPGEEGTGLIPGDLIIETKKKAGSVPDAIESVYVRHSSGGVSRGTFKSYDQKRKSFQGTEIDVCWLDEEAPEDIYGECLIRTMTTNGMIMLTFTPLMGLTPVVLQFMPGGEIPTEQADRFIVRATWDDAPHLSDQDKEDLLASIPPHLKKARSQGIPHLGAGAIYPIPEAEITCDPFEIPVWWPRVYGMDVGWNKTAAVWGAHDRESGVVYLYSEYYQGQAEPPIHAHGILSRGDWIPGVIDPAARGRGQKDGSRLFEDYLDLGLKIDLAENALEGGIYKVWTALSTGKIKVFSTLRNWLTEYRLYRRDEKGKVVKEGDHLMDCTRYIVLSGLNLASIAPEDDDPDAWREEGRSEEHLGRSKVGGY